MRRPRSPRAAALLAGLGLVLTACANSHPTIAVTGEPRQPATPARMPDVLEDDEQQRFTTLLACADQAGVTTTLNDTGPLTLFAPTNAAFAAAGITCNPDDEPSDAAKKQLTRTMQQHLTEFDVALEPPEGFDPKNPPRGLVLVGIGTTTLPSMLTDTDFARLQIDGSAKTVQHVNATAPSHFVGDPIHAPNGYIYVIDKVIEPAPADAVAPSTTLAKPFE